MKTLVVYYSKFGNTRRLAEVVAEAITKAGHVRVINIDQLAVSDLDGADLVVMGTPTHAFSVPQAVRSILDAQPPGILAGKSVAAFDTTVKPWPLRWMRASPKLLRRLRALGGKPVARPQTFFVKLHNTQGTGEINLLLDCEMEQARQWADQITGQLRP